MKIIIIGALAQSLYNFRGDLIKSWVKQGHEVLALAADDSPEVIQKVEDLGCKFKSYAVTRMGANPLQDLQTLWSLKHIFEQEKPDKVYLYTLKPVIWGAFAARLTKTRIDVYALISGLGFSREAETIKKKVLLTVIYNLLRTSLKNAKAVIFQNSDDCKLMQTLDLVKPNICHVVNGSGINLAQFKKTRLPEQPVFLLMARLIVEKGHYQFFEAAKRVRKLYPDARFQILGQLSNSNNAVKVSDLKYWQESSVIEYLGEADDVRPFIEACSVFVLPSYYGEGLPRSILEAMAIGRPIITTDNVGCRETVKNGVNGLLIEKQSSAALAEAMLWMLDNQQAWQTMGDASRQMAEQLFDVNKINQQLLEIMGA